MATTPEGKVKDKIKEAIVLFDQYRRDALGDDTLSSWTYWPVTCGMGRSGVPDVIGLTTDTTTCMPWAIEAKARVSGAKADGPSALQIVEIKEMRERGYWVCCIGQRPGESMEDLRSRVYHILVLWWLDNRTAESLYDYEDRINA